jgi:protein TonB
MVNGEQRMKISGKSRAILISLLLHALVLWSFGGGMLRGPSPDPVVMAVYLAMSPAVPERALDRQASPRKKTSSRPTQARSAPPALEKPMVVPSQPVVTEAIHEEILQPKPGPLKESMPPLRSEERTAEPQQQVATKAPEQVPLFKAILTEDPGFSDNEPIKEHVQATEQSFGNDDSANHQSPMTNHREPLLAFAGDPAALGMFTRDSIGLPLVKARILSLPEPAYPVLSRKRGEEGKVIIEVEISAQGKVLKARVAESSSYPRLDRAALKAVESAAFLPATQYSAPVESVTKVAYRFELKH